MATAPLIIWPTHRPADNRPYGVNWATSNLFAAGETIAQSNWTFPTDAGAPTNPGADKGINGMQTWVRITDGTLGAVYGLFENTITTSLGNVHQAPCLLPMDVAGS